MLPPVSQPPRVKASTLRSRKPASEITLERFSSFLAWLSPDTDRAAEEYERLRYRLCTFFAQRRCSFADELADETINRVILKCTEEIIENKLAYFYGVARNVYREGLRKQRVELDIDDVTLPAAAPQPPGFSGACLDKCLDELSPESKGLILDYFSPKKTAKVQLHRQISAGLKTTQTALRMRIMRIKQKLKTCVHDCMNESPVT